MESEEGVSVCPTDPGPWQGHRCKNASGEVTCPVLSRHVCTTCGLTGKNAHTIRYCPIEQQRKTTAFGGNGASAF